MAAPSVEAIPAVNESRFDLEESLIIEQANKVQQEPCASPKGSADGGEESMRIFPSFPGHQHQRHSRRGVWALLFLLALTTLGTRLFSLPLNRVVELRYCRTYYEENDPAALPSPGMEIPEEMCKVKEVQQRLAWLQGVVETLIIGIDLAVTMPLGWVGDRFGRKVVLGLNAVGFGCLVLWTVLVGRLDRALPVEALIAGPFFTLLGGHDCVLTSTIFAMVTDLTDELVQRTSYIAYITSVNYVISLFGPSLASITMARSIWLPFYLSVAFFVAALPVTCSLPTTLSRKHSEWRRSASTEGGVPEAESLLGSASPQSNVSPPKSSKSLSQRILAPVRTMTHLVIGRHNFQIHLLGGFLLPALASSNTHLLAQYTSKRYGWKFEHVGYLLSAKAAVNITLLALVIPTTMRVLLKRMPRREVQLNYRGAQTSLAVSILGALSISAAGTVGALTCALIVYALGSALPVFTMSLVEATPIAAHSAAPTLPRPELSGEAEGGSQGWRSPKDGPHPSNAQQDYSVVMLVKTIGSLVGAPVMTFAWVKGIGLGGVALGLPYFLSAILYLSAAIVLCFLKL